VADGGKYVTIESELYAGDSCSGVINFDAFKNFEFDFQNSPNPVETLFESSAEYLTREQGKCVQTYELTL
jgi:hypothetical protein